MSTPITNFNVKDCQKIDAEWVNADFSFEIDPENPSILILHNSWGDINIDLSPIVKLNETVTHLKLAPEDAPDSLDYQNETGMHECIDGETLAGIIPLKKLRDMSPDNDWRTGYAPVWDETAGKFIARYVNTEGSMDSRVTALEDNMTIVRATVQNIQAQIGNIETAINSLKDRVTALEELTAKPENIPEDTALAWGNANIYTQTDESTGTFVHDPATAVTGDRHVDTDVT